MKKIIQMAANFSKKLKEIVNGIKTGVQLFKDFISGRLSLKKIVDDIVLAVTTIPDKVSQFKIAKPSQKLNCREFTYSLFVYYMYKCLSCINSGLGMRSYQLPVFAFFL